MWARTGRVSCKSVGGWERHVKLLEHDYGVLVLRMWKESSVAIRFELKRFMRLVFHLACMQVAHRLWNRRDCGSIFGSLQVLCIVVLWHWFNRDDGVVHHKGNHVRVNSFPSLHFLFCIGEWHGQRGYTCEGDLELSRNLGIHRRNRLCKIGYVHCFGFQTSFTGFTYKSLGSMIADVPGCLTL